MPEINELEENKIIGTITASRLDSAMALNEDVLTKTASWLTASLLAINGGGAIAVMNSADRLQAPALVAALFLLGLLFAMLNAVLIQSLSAVLQNPLEQWLAYWRGVEKYGLRQHQSEQELHQLVKRAQRYRWSAPAVGWISGAIFLVAVTMAGANLHVSAWPNASACAKLKKDMISNAPVAPSVPASYVALGCQRL